MKEWSVLRWKISTGGQSLPVESFIKADRADITESGVLVFAAEGEVVAAFADWDETRLVARDPDCECMGCKTGIPT